MFFRFKLNQSIAHAHNEFNMSSSYQCDVAVAARERIVERTVALTHISNVYRMTAYLIEILLKKNFVISDNIVILVKVKLGSSNFDSAQGHCC
jgi:hypothetical protein